jgi:catechol 2,3-dioxygenase-like lactoylglutathione lyase family enzyme
MIHHVGIEVAPADLDRTVEFFTLLGFTEVPNPFDGGFTWLEAAGTQIHLLHDPSPTVPPRAHVAVVCPALDATLARLQEHGFQVEPKAPRWDAPRALATTPGGHGVELMQSPPPRTV